MGVRFAGEKGGDLVAAGKSGGIEQEGVDRRYKDRESLEGTATTRLETTSGSRRQDEWGLSYFQDPRLTPST